MAINAWNTRSSAATVEPDLISAMMLGAEQSGACLRLSFHDYKCMADEILAVLKGKA